MPISEWSRKLEDIRFERINSHFGHDIVVARYGPCCVSIECETCGEVIEDCSLDPGELK